MVTTKYKTIITRYSGGVVFVDFAGFGSDFSVDTYCMKSLRPSNSVRLFGWPSLVSLGSSEPILWRNSCICGTRNVNSSSLYSSDHKKHSNSHYSRRTTSRRSGKTCRCPAMRITFRIRAPVVPAASRRRACAAHQ